MGIRTAVGTALVSASLIVGALAPAAVAAQGTFSAVTQAAVVRNIKAFHWGSSSPSSFAPGGFDMSLLDGRNWLSFQADGNLVQYTRYGDPFYSPIQVVWASGTNGRGRLLAFQGDGNVVIYDGFGRPLWHAGTHRWSGSTPVVRDLVLQADSNAVVYRRDDAPLWSTRGGRTGYSTNW